jgi:hypothetical protein
MMPASAKPNAGPTPGAGAGAKPQTTPAKRIGGILLAIAVMAAAIYFRLGDRLEPRAGPEQIVGQWENAGGDVKTLLTIRADGTFSREHAGARPENVYFMGLSPSGRWTIGPDGILNFTDEFSTTCLTCDPRGNGGDKLLLRESSGSHRVAKFTRFKR